MATVAYQGGYTQESPGLGRLQRILQQPLLIGLVAAGGAGIYAWSSLTGPASGQDDFAPVTRPAPPQIAQVPAAIPEVKFQAAPVTAASPIEAASASPAALSAALPAPAFQAPKPALAPRVAPVPAAPRAVRSPAPDYSYVNRVVLPAPPPVPELPARTVRVEMPPPVAVAAQPRRVTGSFAAPALQSTVTPGIEPASVQLAPAQPLMGSMPPVAPSAVPAAPLQLAPAQPALTLEAPGQQAAPLVTPPAAASPMGASPSPLLSDPQPAPQLAPTAPAADPLQTAPGVASPALSAAAGFQKLDDAQLSGIKSITGQSKPTGRAAIQPEPARNAAPAAAPAKQGESAQAKLPEKVIGSAIDLRLPVDVGGAIRGELPLRIGANGKASVRLGELLALVGEQMDRDTFAALNSSSAASSFVGFEALRAAGMDIGYEAALGEVRLSARSA